MRLALVQADQGAPAHVGVRRPLDHEQGAFDAAVVGRLFEQMLEVAPKPGRDPLGDARFDPARSGSRMRRFTSPAEPALDDAGWWEAPSLAAASAHVRLNRIRLVT